MITGLIILYLIIGMYLGITGANNEHKGKALVISAFILLFFWIIACPYYYAKKAWSELWKI